MHQTASSICEKYTLRHTKLIHVYFTHTVFTRLSQLISFKTQKKMGGSQNQFFFLHQLAFFRNTFTLFFTCKSDHVICTFTLKLQSSLKIEWKNISNGNCTFSIGGGGGGGEGVFMIESILSNWTNSLNQIGIQYRLLWSKTQLLIHDSTFLKH